MARRSWIIALIGSAAFGFARADTPTPRRANRLARESSPYLLQHAQNPVEWYPWGPDAFAKAKKENKLIFLSVGYSSCHWCHVMERESFSNADIAKTLNESFVCIKVDREERPDIDQIYMAALYCCGVKNGGWPLSMFLTPEGKPITGGTYWPPDDKEVGGQPMLGFKSVLRRMIELERTRGKDLREQAVVVAELTRKSLAQATKSIVGAEPSRPLVDAALEALEGSFDPEYGGFGNPQKSFHGAKFPTPPSLELLWTAGARRPELHKHVLKTLTAMARGGIYDQVGGGFHRYSTDRTWSVPHFEKMLYDNAQLVELYALAFAETQNPLFRRVVDETLEFVRRDLTSPGGGFFSALDADADGDEGKSYVWTTAELRAALPAAGEFELACRSFGCEGAPNFEGRAFVLTRPDRGVEPMEPLQSVRRQLLTARNHRPRPFLDTKILTGWNGQMIAAYAEAGRLLAEPKYVEAAVAAATFTLANLRSSDGRLARVFAAAPGEAPQARGAAFLDDYTYLVDGLLSLHDATKAERWLKEAKAMTEIMIKHYGDPESGGFYFSAADQETLFVRTKDSFDGAQPSGNSMAVRNLLRLARRTGDQRYQALAAKALRAFAPALEQNPTGLATMVLSLDEFLANERPDPAPLAPQPPGGGAAKRSDSVVKVTAKADKPGSDGKQVVRMTLKIDKGWHIYANPVGNEGLESSETSVKVMAKTNVNAIIDYPKAKVVQDKLVGNYNVYDDEAVIRATVEWPKGASPETLEIQVKVQACNDKTCLLPATIKLTVP